jgi:hypothetical protein
MLRRLGSRHAMTGAIANPACGSPVGYRRLPKMGDDVRKTLVVPAKAGT